MNENKETKMNRAVNRKLLLSTIKYEIKIQEKKLRVEHKKNKMVTY